MPEVKKAIKAKKCLFGTVDTWLLWNLTGGPNGGVHITDVTNASRTFLMNIETFHWDPLLIHTFKVPEDILPEIRSSSEIYGKISGEDFPLKDVPISGVSTKFISISNLKHGWKREKQNNRINVTNS